MLYCFLLHSTALGILDHLLHALPTISQRQMVLCSQKSLQSKSNIFSCDFTLCSLYAHYALILSSLANLRTLKRIVSNQWAHNERTDCAQWAQVCSPSLFTTTLGMITTTLLTTVISHWGSLLTRGKVITKWIFHLTYIHPYLSFCLSQQRKNFWLKSYLYSMLVWWAFFWWIPNKACLQHRQDMARSFNDPGKQVARGNKLLLE